MKNINKSIKISNSHIFLLSSFLIPFLIRFIPEIFMGEFIIGFDTLNYYIPETIKLTNLNFLEFFGLAPLFYLLLKYLTTIGLPLTILLKILPSIIHGLLGLTIYSYTLKRIRWPESKSLSASLLATLYFVSLRISWDMLRSELGLIFLFVFLILIKDRKEKTFKNYGLLSIISVLIVFTHQLVSIIMFTIIIILIICKKSNEEYFSVIKFTLSLIPATIFYCLTIYSNLVIPQFSIISNFPSYEGKGWLSLFGFSSYFSLTMNILSFVFFCYIFLLPFVILGFKKVHNTELKVWCYLCFISILSPIISPNLFIPGGYRWTIFLMFPLVFFTIEGLEKINFKWQKVFGGMIILLSLSFIILPAEVALPFFRAFPNYIPSSMLQNSVSMNDCEDVVNALSWVKVKIEENGSLLVHDAFQGWAFLFLDNNQIISYEYNDPSEFAQNIIDDSKLFLIWWILGEGWHGLDTLQSDFKIVFSSNKIAIYEFIRSEAKIEG